MEETVGAVFHDLGFDSVVTAYHADNGIDVILAEKNGTNVGVQIKRSKNRIDAEQIRAFVGALVLGGFTRGTFVVTSDFTRGAIKTAKGSCEQGIPIELINADRFFDVLKLAARPKYSSYDDWHDSVGKVNHALYLNAEDFS